MNESVFQMVIVVLLILSDSASGEIYKWTDEQGKVHFTDSPPNKEKAEVLDEEALAKRISSYKQVAVNIVPIDFGVNLQTNMLVMYTTTRCGYCAKARRYFAKKDIAYIEKNITTSEGYRSEFKAFGGKGVPVIFAGKYQMTGFSANRFELMYSKAKLRR